MFQCPKCGGHVVFEPTLQKMKCEYCDSLFDPEPGDIPKDEKEGEAKVEVTEANDQYEANVYTCPQCGGEIISDADTAVTFCSYCGSSTVLEGRLTKIRKPDYVIPFVKTKEEAEAAYRQTMSRALFAPSSVKNDTVVERFRGIYMPYWVYDFQTDGRTVIQGVHDHRRGNYIYHDHYDVKSDLHANYEGIAFDASSSFSDSLSQAIAPYDTKEKKPFDEGYLAGFYADTSDIPEFVYQNDAREMVRADLANRLMQTGNYSPYGVSAMDAARMVGPDKEDSKMGYFPVWFLANRTKDRISYAVVNGQTGRVAADIPISFTKYMVGALVVAVPVFLLLMTLFTITPHRAVVITMLLGIAAAIINAIQKGQVYRRENYLDDAGMQELNRRKEAEAQGKDPMSNAEKRRRSQKTVGGEVSPDILSIFGGISYIVVAVVVYFFAGAFAVFIALAALNAILNSAGLTKTKRVVHKDAPKGKVPFSEKFSSMLKPLIGFMIGACVMVWNPVSDLYYYGAILAAMAFVLWSFADMVGLHNRLATRPLPQFGKRGGDE
ncbi:MAG: TFIIB-type zinc ribbon-containing protein [Lachnospiraceae bacterium]|nr:TFIIB-type zinc ribbon-containing protein [Lachnospiraceae bacterium]MBQ2532197.1 TFIIB-type zinc ribbon-containing protein [Lachnospiraceae bacterium]MBQ5386432.1 TFIIB-type zinc ribbon-containing protein [Lachnospiraceae bacterium]